ncbi:MAG: hypothetical protein J6K96_03345 [Treponema sp.]|nr:hypothetical protein [Treponema sp.]
MLWQELTQQFSSILRPNGSNFLAAARIEAAVFINAATNGSSSLAAAKIKAAIFVNIATKWKQFPYCGKN